MVHEQNSNNNIPDETNFNFSNMTQYETLACKIIKYSDALHISLCTDNQGKIKLNVITTPKRDLK